LKEFLVVIIEIYTKFLLENPKGKDNVEYIAADGGVIVNWILKK
jgi:hypothetical protein